MNPEKLELSELVDKFLVHKRSEGWSERTVEWYQQALGLFQAWLEEEGMSTRLDDLGEDEMRLFILHLKGRPGLRGPASSHTVNSRVRAVRAFFNWPYEEDYTECHRLLKVRPPKPRELEIEILTDEEIERTFASINPHTVLGARNTAIYSLMLDTGLRLTEVVTLKYQDAHLDNRYVKILGKGDKERIVAFGTTCQRALLNYDQHYRFANQGQEAETFFLCIDGHPMGAEGLRSLTERLSKTAGIPRLHPHLIRHTYATRFLLNGGDSLLCSRTWGIHPLRWSVSMFT
jgi:integrase/recombinase XerC/integrase/recombinase XerD